MPEHTLGELACARVLLVLCVVIVVLAARAVLTRVDERRPSIVLSLSLALLAVAPALLGRPFDSLGAGLAATGVVCAPLAWFGARELARIRCPDVPMTAETLAFVVVAALLVALGAWVEIGARLWDGELAHYGFASSIARGVLPPEHPLFPGEPLRYHAGFDVLVALVVITGVSVGAAVHAVSLALLALTCLVAHDAVRALAISQGTSWGAQWAVACAPAVVLLGYGPASACLAGGWAAPSLASCGALFPSTWVGAQSMPPAVMSSFFQHPQGLAMPIALSLVLLCDRFERPKAHGRMVVCGAGLVLLSQCQIVFFACVGFAIGMVTVADAVLRRRIADAAVRAVIFGAAGAVGLWTSHIASGVGELRFGRGYFNDGPAMLALHHLALFGLTVIAVPIAVARVVRGPMQHGAHVRAVVAVAASAGFVVANTCTYARSWDIVKFFAVAAFFSNVLLAELLTALAARRGPWRVLACGLFALSIASASFWLLRHGPLNGVIAPSYGLNAPSPLGKALLARAGDRIGTRDVVLTSRIDIWQLGFHVAGAGRQAAKGQLIDLLRADERHRIAQRALRTFERRDLEALSVDWVLTRESVPAERFALEDEVLDHHLYRVLP
jgi:hypothetical protein